MGKMKMEDSGFATPVESSIRVKEVKSPWNFKSPSFDRSKMIQAGDKYGIGTRSPVGHKGPSKQRAATLPYGRVQTMENTASELDRIKIYDKD